jgi:CRISPR-associated protein Cas1
MPTLYVLEPGARIEKEYRRILVTKHDEILMRVPLSRISQVVLVGRVGATTPALHALLNAEVPLLMVSRSGKLLGRLLPPTAANLPRRMAQFERNTDDEFTLSFARAVAAGKIRNQRVLIQRINRNREDIQAERELASMKEAIQAAEHAESLDVLLGFEGQAARSYFQVYRKAFSEKWAFKKRTRRPPKDSINSLLSFGYTFLTYAAMAALEVVGLDPYLGYFHTEKYGRPALALDLAEEFRSPIVDSLILMLINRRTIQEEDFQQDAKNPGIYLNQRGLTTFFQKFSRRMETEITPRELGRSISYRKLLEVQAHKIARYIHGQDDTYRPFRAR